MEKELVLQLRYIGMLPKIEYREYRFFIADEDKGGRPVVLTIDNGFFLKNLLRFQEAPDLCYQKMLSDLRSETKDAPIRSRSQVTAADIEFYREAHPTTRPRKGILRRGL
jgi:hypothetical protein